MKRFLPPLLYLLGFLLVSGALAFKVFQPIQVLPRIRLAPAFSAIDQDGQPLTSEDLRGKVVVYTFLYTRCTSARCAELVTTLQEVRQRLTEAELGEVPLVFVTFSFDPEHDTPAALQAMAEKVGAAPPQWYWVTLPDESLLKTVLGGGFNLYYQRQPNGSFAFDPLIVLVDGWGIVRGEYRYRTQVPTAERLLRHLRALGSEIRNSRGTARLAYEAAHLFLCYVP